MKLGEYDDIVKEYVHHLRLAGGIINRSIVIAAARGILSHLAPNRLKEHGGDIEIERSWAQSFLGRLGYVRRKGTKAARKIPANFEEIKAEFAHRVNEACKADSDLLVPPQLIINFDQTNAKYVPVSEWTLAKEGSKQVPIIGLEDKREMTVLLACTLSGQLLPPQLIYAGRTSRCHPSVSFPEGWNISHSENHWSTEETMIEYVDQIILPYVQDVRTSLELSPSFPAVAIFDVFAAHRCQSVLNRLSSNNIKYVFVPAGCTGELQPLDITVNDFFKKELRSCFSSWYAKRVKEELEAGIDIQEMKIDLRISLLKPIHANWLIDVIFKLKTQEGLIKTGFDKAGITACLNIA